MKHILILGLLFTSIFAGVLSGHYAECEKLLNNADRARKVVESNVNKILNSESFVYNVATTDMLINFSRMEQERFLICNKYNICDKEN